MSPAQRSMVYELLRSSSAAGASPSPTSAQAKRPKTSEATSMEEGAG